MKELSNRTARFTDSVIRRMTRISNKYGAVNLSQGFPDFDPPAQLLDSLSAIASDPNPLYHQYSITWGSQAMREALAAKQEHFMGMPGTPTNIVVTCGSTEAMMAAMMTVTNPATRSSSSRRSTRTTAPTQSFGCRAHLRAAQPTHIRL
ncbi:MAG: hypothetical protein ACLRM9_06480 [Collinsella aerofaciens]